MVIATLKINRGFLGALGEFPSITFSEDFCPNGSVTNQQIHQTIMKIIIILNTLKLLSNFFLLIQLECHKSLLGVKTRLEGRGPQFGVPHFPKHERHSLINDL